MEPWITVIATAVIQIVSIAYVTGKYSQMMADHGRRISDLEEDTRVRILPKLDAYGTRISLVEQQVMHQRTHE